MDELFPPEGNGPLLRERLRTARLYFVCDARPDGVDPEPLLRAALGGGVDIVQLREKQLGRAEIERAASTFRRIADTYPALFIVNDDPDLARACDADGVHVGQDDASVEEARACSGRTRSSASRPTPRSRSRRPTRATSTTSRSGRSGRRRRNRGAPAVGLELVTHAAEARRNPFFAIGGIGPLNAGQVVAAGAQRLCVVRAIRDAPHPEVAAEALRRFEAEGSTRGVAPGG